MQFPLLLFSFFMAMIISLGSLPLLIKIGEHYKLFDLPGGRKRHSGTISRLGGIAILFGSLTPIWIILPMGQPLPAYLAGALILFFGGFWDDLKPLHFAVKFSFQIIIGLIIVFWGGIHIDSLSFSMIFSAPQWLVDLVSIGFIVGVINAANFADGLDGLAGGVSLISLGGFALLAFPVNEPFILVLALSIMGAIYGFLRFNMHPARIFMGDTGSQFLGFSLAVLALMLTQVDHGAYPFPLPLLMLGIPILDTVGVLIQRLLVGQSPFRADNKHLHYKLLTVGLFHHEVVIMMYFAQSVMLFLAYLFRFEEEALVWGFLAFISFSVLALYVLSAFSLLDWCRLKRDRRRSISRPVKWWIKQRPWARKRPVQVLEFGILLFLTLSVLMPISVPFELGALSICFFLFLMLSMVFFRNRAHFAIHLSFYAAGTFILYFSKPISMVINFSTGWIQAVIFFAVLSLMAIIFLAQLLEDQPFQFTSLDFLILFLGFITLFFFHGDVSGSNVGVFSGKLIVLFISYELVMNHPSKSDSRFGVALLWVFFVFALRAWST